MSKESNIGGIGFGGTAWVVLIILKFAGVIQMSWFWVLTSFIWVGLISAVIIFIFLFLLVILNELLG